jgi:hypothetical protein
MISDDWTDTRIRNIAIKKALNEERYSDFYSSSLDGDKPCSPCADILC